MQANLKQVVLLAIMVLGTAYSSYAGIITVPPSLNPGDTYRLVFITSVFTNATSTQISDYNAFVTDAANGVAALANLGATWTAIASTESTDAITNIGSSPDSVGIFTLGGLLVADGTSGLFSGGSILTAINITQNGTVISYPYRVWTGTTSTGTLYPGWSLGDTNPATGNIGATGSGQWLTNNLLFPSENNYYPLYAISSPLTLGPEPTPIALSVLGLGILYFAKRAAR
jgi:hypothetical protein